MPITNQRSQQTVKNQNPGDFQLIREVLNLIARGEQPYDFQLGLALLALDRIEADQPAATETDPRTPAPGATRFEHEVAGLAFVAETAPQGAPTATCGSMSADLCEHGNIARHCRGNR
jgi:hypothetical protein